MEKTKLLYIGDFGKTGFGTVSYGFLSNLVKTGRYDILQLGINYNDADPVEVPWKLMPAGFYFPSNGMYECADAYGFTKADQWVEKFDPDIVFINNDIPVADKYLTRQGKPTKLAQHRSKKILYTPVDSWPFPPLFRDICKKFDHLIAYSYFQYDMMVTADESFKDIDVLYHGVDTSVYYPMDKTKAKRKLEKVLRKYNSRKKTPKFEDKFLVYFVGTNQWRKDLPCLYVAFKDFHDKYPDSFLIPHTSAIPMSPDHGGWLLDNLRGLVGVSDSVIFKYANIFTPEEMNIFYNAADVLAYPTRGEGFGLPSIEAMATKTPVIATRFGPQYELHADGRGLFIEVSGYEVGNRSAVTWYAKPSAQSLSEQMQYLYNNPEEAASIANTAYEWVLNHTWADKAEELDRILQKCLLLSNTPSKLQSTPKRRKKTLSTAMSAAG